MYYPIARFCHSGGIDTTIKLIIKHLKRPMFILKNICYLAIFISGAFVFGTRDSGLGIRDFCGMHGYIRVRVYVRVCVRYRNISVSI